MKKFFAGKILRWNWVEKFNVLEYVTGDWVFTVVYVSSERFLLFVLGVLSKTKKKIFMILLNSTFFLCDIKWAPFDRINFFPRYFINAIKWNNEFFGFCEDGEENFKIFGIFWRSVFILKFCGQKIILEFKDLRIYETALAWLRLWGGTAVKSGVLNSFK